MYAAYGGDAKAVLARPGAAPSIPPLPNTRTPDPARGYINWLYKSIFCSSSSIGAADATAHVLQPTVDTLPVMVGAAMAPSQLHTTSSSSQSPQNQPSSSIPTNQPSSSSQIPSGRERNSEHTIAVRFVFVIQIRRNLRSSKSPRTQSASTGLQPKRTTSRIPSGSEPAEATTICKHAQVVFHDTQAPFGV